MTSDWFGSLSGYDETILDTFLGAMAATCLGRAVKAGSAPDIVWEVPTPSALANSIQGVGWSPAASGQMVFGSTDRWIRMRQAENGALGYSVLQPRFTPDGARLVTTGYLPYLDNAGSGSKRA